MNNDADSAQFIHEIELLASGKPCVRILPGEKLSPWAEGMEDILVDNGVYELEAVEPSLNCTMLRVRERPTPYVNNTIRQWTWVVNARNAEILVPPAGQHRQHPHSLN